MNKSLSFITSEKNIVIDRFSTLGKEIKISPKSLVTVNKSGLKVEHNTETVALTIGIGEDHVAELIMSKDAFDALNKGEEVSITTLKEFKTKYL